MQEIEALNRAATMVFILALILAVMLLACLYIIATRLPPLRSLGEALGLKTLKLPKLWRGPKAPSGNGLAPEAMARGDEQLFADLQTTLLPSLRAAGDSRLTQFEITGVDAKNLQFTVTAVAPSASPGVPGKCKTAHCKVIFTPRLQARVWNDLVRVAKSAPLDANNLDIEGVVNVILEVLLLAPQLNVVVSEEDVSDIPKPTH